MGCKAYILGQIPTQHWNGPYSLENHNIGQLHTAGGACPETLSQRSSTRALTLLPRVSGCQWGARPLSLRDLRLS